MTEFTDIKAWPFAEARALLKSLENKTPNKGFVLFETGYGPSGLPHIGTFGEVARTSMVRHAFSLISDVPTKLFAFSDDMDGLRKVPDNIPKKELIAKYLGSPLTSVPDPFGTHESFGHHNNAKLKSFLDSFGFEYEFKSATECYKSGQFDTTLLKVLENYEEINGIILPTLGQERRATYSPFLPISKTTQKVLQVPILSRDTDAGTIVFVDEDGTKVETPVTGGNCKLQWKVDWAMRWASLDVNYEMSGKDLIESVKLSGKISRILGKPPPSGFTYELFLDERGEKISKSRGNGLSVEEWLSYAPKESLSLFMFQKPKSAKRLYFDIIPKNVDDYLSYVRSLNSAESSDHYRNPAWYIHKGHPPQPEQLLSYSLLLNLASVCNTEDRDILWYFISRYLPETSPDNSPFLEKLVNCAINYYRDFVKPHKRYRKATVEEISALKELLEVFVSLQAEADTETIQSAIYKVGKKYFPNDLRIWFKSLYEILLGQPNGPRMGSFVAIYGLDETIQLIKKVIKGEDLN